jgi:hypothetical protein
MPIGPTLPLGPLAGVSGERREERMDLNKLENYYLKDYIKLRVCVKT